MSEKNERPKPPARRTGGRALGGAKKTTPPPPPPAAELTPEQFAAEQGAGQGEGRLAVAEAEVQQPSTAPVGTGAQGESTGILAEVPEPQAPPAVDAAPSGPVQAPAAGAPAMHSVPPGHLTHGHEQFAARTGEVAVPAAPSTQVSEQVPQAGLSHAVTTAAGVSPTAEVAVRQTVSPVPGATAFPVRSDAPASHQEQNTRSEAAPSEGAPWAQGPGRPKDIPETAAVLNQRIITRESLDSSVPAALKLKKRIKRFALDNELDHLPIGDIVSVALDEWLTARGF
ncbi:hypothetical protein ABZ896_48390 [Streptomyces sp. NPDC047072]|uniref:hypothetical protein n=1 Tax=Streptomyces sp. NPDC047072 TaxID=3154809 RepID=UPI003403BDFB